MAESIAIWIEETDGMVLNRHRYVAHVIFEVILGWEVIWPSSKIEWNAAGFRLQYGGVGPEASSQLTWVPASGLLTGGGLQWIWSDSKGPGIPGVGRLPFGVPNALHERIDADWWSWVFWMVTRMEEQAPPQESLDGFGRFKASASLGHQEGWLKRPEVESRVYSWAKSLGKEPASRSFSVVPTVDVDSAFAYKHRSFYRATGAAIRDALRGDWSRIKERKKVLRGEVSDPFDTYDWLERIHRQHGLRARYFFLLADRSEHDRGMSWKSNGIKALIRRVKETADIGIHPGFASHESQNIERLTDEIARLHALSEEGVLHSRQHYLLQRCGPSWRRLEAAGIEHDYTLGFADEVGFRAGMSRPFPAFDLAKDERMSLTLHPLAAMDATLQRYMGCTPAEALDELESLANEVKAVDGSMMLLWHNETVSDRWDWEGWRTVYEEVFSLICQN